MGFLKKIGKTLADILAEPKQKEYGMSQREEILRNKGCDITEENKRRKEREGYHTADYG